jgi:hypothetical protein
MTRRGSRRQAAVSLFSFQDIITSVTAIMILIVLILALELVSRSQRTEVAAEDRQVASQLKEAVEALERRAVELRAEAEAAAGTAREAAGISAAELEYREQEARRLVRELTEENGILRQRVTAGAIERRKAERMLRDITANPASIHAQADAVALRSREISAANQRERERQNGERVTRTSVTAETLVFNPDPTNSRRPRLVEVSGEGVALMPSERGPPEVFAWGLLGGVPGRFVRWVEGIDSDREYVVFILRPSGVAYFPDVKEVVQRNNVELGLELVGEAVGVSLGERRGG